MTLVGECTFSPDNAVGTGLPRPMPQFPAATQEIEQRTTWQIDRGDIESAALNGG